eukprot:TRINITY_DN18982_c0_g2_i1.p1 TRINITY_DN18982_c0_g2~~TRINITY_DN18982_c0_g2_i1.p1  ORF type:complete len:388 (-),score=97.88 TRINITY_DN18982_c0_g2_i1:138-1301(-)
MVLGWSTMKSCIGNCFSFKPGSPKPTSAPGSTDSTSHVVPKAAGENRTSASGGGAVARPRRTASPAPKVAAKPAEASGAKVKAAEAQTGGSPSSSGSTARDVVAPRAVGTNTACVLALVLALGCGATHLAVNFAAGDHEEHDAASQWRVDGHFDRDRDGKVDMWDVVHHMDQEYDPSSPAYMDAAFDCCAEHPTVPLTKCCERARGELNEGEGGAFEDADLLHRGLFVLMRGFSLAHRLLRSLGRLLRVLLGAFCYGTGAVGITLLVSGQWHALCKRIDDDIKAAMGDILGKFQFGGSNGVIDQLINTILVLPVVMVMSVVLLPCFLISSAVHRTLQALSASLPWLVLGAGVFYCLPPHALAIANTVLKAFGAIFWLGALGALIVGK